MEELPGNRIGTALQRLAEDLVTERRRVALLRRENRELRKQLELLQRPSEALDGSIEGQEPQVRSAR